MMTRYIETPLADRFASKFEIVALRDNDDHVRSIREAAFKTFQRLGFPSIKNEEWRFTNLVRFLKDDYELNLYSQEYSDSELARLDKLVTDHITEVNTIGGEAKRDHWRIVTVNGILNRKLSHLPEQQKFKVETFEQVESTELFKKHFGKILKPDGLSALNTALFNGGFMVEVPANQVVERPVYLVHVYTANEDAWMNPRSLIVMGRSSQMDLIEMSIGDHEEHKLFVNGLSELALGEQAQLDHYDIQIGVENQRFVNRTHATQKRYSNYRNYTFTFPGADIVRNTLNLFIDDVDVESHLYGLYFSAGKQLVDNHTEVHHLYPNGLSNQLYKGVLLDHSKAVFNGKIYVYEDAQKTNAFQQSNNILLSDRAVVNAKPQLEIFADDVKASHGTTVGQLDEEAIFYLKCRGIGEATARNMMVNAFAFDVSRKVKDDVIRTYLENIIQQKMDEATQAS